MSTVILLHYMWWCVCSAHNKLREDQEAKAAQIPMVETHHPPAVQPTLPPAYEENVSFTKNASAPTLESSLYNCSNGNWKAAASSDKQHNALNRF